MARRRPGRPKGPATTPVAIVIPVTARDQIRELATKEGLTVAGWIRRVAFLALAEQLETKAA